MNALMARAERGLQRAIGHVSMQAAFWSGMLLAVTVVVAVTTIAIIIAVVVAAGAIYVAMDVAAVILDMVAQIGDLAIEAADLDPIPLAALIRASALQIAQSRLIAAHIRDVAIDVAAALVAVIVIVRLCGACPYRSDKESHRSQGRSPRNHAFHFLSSSFGLKG